MRIDIYSRDDDDVNKVLTVHNNGTYIGSKKIFDWITSVDWEQLGGKFDPTNKEHITIFPTVLHGSRIWAVLNKGQ